MNPRNLADDQLAELFLSDRSPARGALVTVHDIRSWALSRLMDLQARQEELARYGMAAWRRESELAELAAWRDVEGRAAGVLAAVEALAGTVHDKAQDQPPADQWAAQQRGTYDYDPAELEAMSMQHYGGFREQFAWSGPITHQVRQETPWVSPQAPVPTWALRPADDGRLTNYTPPRVGRPGE